MNLNVSKAILKVVGIISTILGGLGTAAGVYFIIAALITTQAPQLGDANDLATILIIGIILLIISIMPLLQGIFALRGASNSSKIMPAWIFSVISLILSACGLMANAIDFLGLKVILASSVALAISIIIFLAANTIRKHRNDEAA